MTAARATEDEDDDSMSRAIVARTGWATRRGGREGEEGGGRDEADASSADDDERRRRRLAAAAGEQRAIVPSVSGSGGLFRSLEGYFPRARVSSAALDEQKKKRDGSGFEENRTRGKEKEKAFDALSRKSKNGSGGQVSENEKTSSTFSLSRLGATTKRHFLPLSPLSLLLVSPLKQCRDKAPGTLPSGQSTPALEAAAGATAEAAGRGCVFSKKRRSRAPCRECWFGAAAPKETESDSSLHSLSARFNQLSFPFVHGSDDFFSSKTEERKRGPQRDELGKRKESFFAHSSPSLFSF